MIAFARALRPLLGEDDRGHLEMHARTAPVRVTRKGRGRR